MSGSFLPPVVMTIVADAKKFLDEQGRVIKAGDEASRKIIEQAERNAAAAETEARKAQEAADKKIAAADKAAAAAEAAIARTEKAYAELAAATEEDQAKAAAAVEKATQKQEAALARLDAAIDAQAKAEKASADATEAAEARKVAATEAAATKSSGHFASMGKVAGKTAMVMGGAAVAVGIGAADMAAHFQTSSTKLVTSAGESETAIAGVRDGLLKLAGDVGVGPKQLADDMYKVESAGYHGAAGLNVLKAAEQGAKAEGADGAKVADALSSAMRDYYPHAQSAADVTKASTEVMSKFIGATSAGKMSFDDLAGSLNSILPVSSAAGISLNDTMGVLASMTVHGISADQATQNMADAIRHLQAPTATMSKEMAALGIDSTDVAAKLGERGLSGTMQFLSEKVKAAMPPGTNEVILQLGNALSKSTPQVQELGQKLMDGSITLKDFTQAAKDMDPISAGQAKQFATLANSTHQIGNKMISGADVLQTYGGAMAKVMGDATGLKVALMTTGENTQYTNDAIKQVSASTADAQGNVKGWADVQKNAGQSMAELKATVEALAVKLGEALLPILKTAADALKGFIDWASSNPGAFQAIALSIMGVSIALGAAAAAAAIGSIAFTSVGLVVGGVVIAIIALGAAIAWLVTHWSDVTSFIKTVWDGFVGWLKGIMDAVATWWHSWWDPFAKVVSDVWNVIVTVAKVALAILFTAILTPIKIELDLLGKAWNWLYQNAIKPAWEGIVQVATAAWIWLSGNVFKPIGDAIDFMGKMWNWYWQNVVVPVWNGIMQVIGAVWQWLVSNVVQPIHDWLDLMGREWNWFNQNVIQPVWAAIQKAIGDAWNWLSQNVFDPIGKALDAMGKGFQVAQTIVADAWQKIQDAARGPVQFIIDTVYNHGIREVWNSIAQPLGLATLGAVELGGGGSGGAGVSVSGGPVKAFASGGIMPGYTPGRDVYTIAVSGGEAIMRPEWTRMIGPDRIHAMNRAAAQGNTSAVQSMMGFADGGIVGDIGNFLGGALNTIKDVALGGLKAAATPIIQGIEGVADGTLGGTGYGKMLDAGVHKLGDGFLNWIGGKDDSAKKAAAGSAGSIGAPGAVSGDLAGWVQAGMAAAGVSGANWLNGLETIAMHESGGNPNAANNWDSNAAMGDPSRGLMQTIGSTFEAYRVASLPNDIFDPVANVAAGIGYIKSRYGDISNVPGLVSMAQGGGYVGYASGGITPVLYDTGGWLPPGRTLVQNNTGQPERVLAPGQTGGHTVNVSVQSQADPYAIAAEVGWALKAFS